jgi:hypothetical protein
MAVKRRTVGVVCPDCGQTRQVRLEHGEPRSTGRCQQCHNRHVNAGLQASRDAYWEANPGKGYKRGGDKRDHVVVMEAHLGRALLPGEVVHHKNLDKRDNRLENLQLMTNSEHVRLHARLRKEAKGTTP